jgi:hypothetical protein
MGGRDLRAKIVRGQVVAVTRGWAAWSATSRLLARGAGFLARRSVRIAAALRSVGHRLDRLAAQAQARAKDAMAGAQVSAEALPDATIVMPLPPVVPGLPRVAPPPGAEATVKSGPRLPPPPARRTSSVRDLPS